MTDTTITSLPAPQVSPSPDKSPAGVARQFEGVFAGQVAKMMLESVDQGDEFSGGHGEEMFRGVLAEQVGNQIAKGKGLGIASAVQAQIIRMQGGNPQGVTGNAE
ncbi:rod binding protein [Novosphingobium sp. PhB165]|uniref:rod-binding protein n=1 Tax=Novosphingobium sp. PhB165 TaxID=2485105 RepID=UPI0010482119|nr:rod-binding protein [Novosphingobium sp. PhB165]TCM17736.1 rod binding protein [Novosphingobium sp. PhB165]